MAATPEAWSDSTFFRDAIDTEHTRGGPCLVPGMCPDGGACDPLPVLVVRAVRRPDSAAQRFERGVTRSEQARRLRWLPLGSPYTIQTNQAVSQPDLAGRPRVETRAAHP